MVMALSATLNTQGKIRRWKVEEIDHRAEADPVDGVADRPADDQAEADAPAAAGRPCAPRQASSDRDAPARRPPAPSGPGRASARSRPKLTPGFQTMVRLERAGDRHRDPRAAGRSTSRIQYLTIWSSDDDRRRPGRRPPSPAAGRTRRSVGVGSIGHGRRPRRPRRRRRAATGPDSAGRSPPPAGSARSGRTCGPRRAAARRRRRRPRAGGRRRPGLRRRPASPGWCGTPRRRRGRRRRPAGSASATWTTGAASSAAPMRFSRRSTSSAPVTTRGHRLHLGPARGLGVVAPVGRRLRDHPQAVGAGVGEAGGPGLFHGEGGQRGEPGGQALEHLVHHRARGAAARRCRAGRSRGRRGGCRR